MSVLKLKEVLWEVTNNCNRNCAYCGSKDIINKGDDLPFEKKYLIAEEIAKNSDNVTLTGGEPLTLPQLELEALRNIFNQYECTMDVVTNGDMLQHFHGSIFDNIGISVNSKEDAEHVDEIIKKTELECRIVIITNVNKVNYFDLEDIADLCRQWGFTWQVQLTMYKCHDKEMFDGEHINELREKIKNICTEDDDVEYVFADNLQEEHDCHAGISSCGILYNGDVVYCLSERAWLDHSRVQGNCLQVSLKNIWENNFKENRFDDDFESCRSCFNYPKCKSHVNINEELPSIFDQNKKYVPPYDEMVILYGVVKPNTPPPPRNERTVYVYGVAKPYPEVDMSKWHFKTELSSSTINPEDEDTSL